MRKQERGIRQTKREIEAMRNLGEDTSALERKLSKQMKDYRSFSKAANINPRNYALGVQPNTSNLGNTRTYKRYANQPKESGLIKPLFSRRGEAIEKLRETSIEYIKVKDLKTPLSEDEIIKKISRDDIDKAGGSCASLALAYIGNKAGWDVDDFRGGSSRLFFSQPSVIREISKLNGVISFSEENTDDELAVIRLLRKIKPGKEYLLSTGSHAAIIRRKENGTEYLNLQSKNPKENGFFNLSLTELETRFKCKDIHIVEGTIAKAESLVIDIETLYNNKEFKRILGYLNTAGVRNE